MTYYLGEVEDIESMGGVCDDDDDVDHDDDDGDNDDVGTPRFPDLKWSTCCEFTALRQ